MSAVEIEALQYADDVLEVANPDVPARKGDPLDRRAGFRNDLVPLFERGTVRSGHEDVVVGGVQVRLDHDPITGPPRREMRPVPDGHGDDGAVGPEVHEVEVVGSRASLVDREERVAAITR
jgi:hypothetical protein